MFLQASFYGILSSFPVFSVYVCVCVSLSLYIYMQYI
jgi:hypothetical protein